MGLYLSNLRHIVWILSMIVLHTIVLHKCVKYLNEMTHLYLTYFHLCVSYVLFNTFYSTRGHVRLQYLINNNCKHIYDWRIYKCDDRNQMSKFQIFFRLAESTELLFVNSRSQKFIVLLSQYRVTSELSVLKNWRSSGGVKKIRTALLNWTWLPLHVLICELPFSTFGHVLAN